MTLGPSARRAALLIGVLALTGARPRDPFAGRVAGTPADCVHFVPGEALVIADAGTITYRDGTTLWRNGPTGSCTPMRPTDTLIVEMFAGRICRNDHFRVVASGTSARSGICSFGPFTPYTTQAR